MLLLDDLGDSQYPELGGLTPLQAARTPNLDRADNLEVLTVVASDHSTPGSGTMIHSGEPVPVIMRETTIRRDGVAVYDEIEAACGSPGMMRGRELMRMVLNALDRAGLRGIRNDPVELLWWSAPGSALNLD